MEQNFVEYACLEDKTARTTLICKSIFGPLRLKSVEKKQVERNDNNYS